MHSFFFLKLQLTTAQDRGGLSKVSEFVGTIFLQCEKIFWSFTSQLQPVLKCSGLVQQKMQTNSIVISNFNSLSYDIDPRINKEISFNLVENMLTLFTKVQSFSYAIDIKEKHKI